ncbi:MAG: hypothetical protein ACLQVW_02800, partial [Limisphaerales bacterium]
SKWDPPSCENIAPSTLHERVRRCWRDNRQPKNPRPKTSGIGRPARSLRRPAEGTAVRGDSPCFES